jgi:hypothetical protein
MNLFFFCWLNSGYDLEDIQKSPKFERMLFPLYFDKQSPVARCMLHRLHVIEGKLLYHKISPSPRQLARYWFVAAEWYRKLNRVSSAFNAYETCSRSLAGDDLMAQLVLHSHWGLISEAIKCPCQAEESYEVVVDMTHRLADKLALPLATEDNQPFMAALSYRLKHSLK